MNKISITIILIIIILGIGIIIAVFTPYSVPFVSEFFSKETPKDLEVLEVIPTTPDDITPVVDNSTTPPSQSENDEVLPEPQPEDDEPSAQEPKTTREPQEHIIRINSATDWQSANLTIYEGDTVTFINLDNDLHWPGADPHPTHSSLPLFDALGGISEGQSYSYTFTIPGSYGHHDHLPDDPPTLGIITVLPLE